MIFFPQMEHSGVVHMLKTRKVDGMMLYMYMYMYTCKFIYMLRPLYMEKN